VLHGNHNQQGGLKMLTILLCWCFSLFPHNDVETSIKTLFETKQTAVNVGDMPSFLATIYPDRHYQQEQKHWFLDAVSYIDPKSFRMQVMKIRQLSRDKFQVEVKQSYQRKHHIYSVTYPVVVKRTVSGLKDADSLLCQLKKGSISIKYSDLRLKKQAERALVILKRASEILENKYHWKATLIEVKLYHDSESFRQSVKLSLPRWAGGWNEAKQAIKLVVGEADVESLRHGLAHEYTHQVVSALTNDNAAYWLQEGAAMYYEALISGERPLIGGDFKSYTIKELEQLNLEQLSDEDAYNYYLSCYIQFRKLVGTFGEAGIRQVFDKLYQFGFNDLDSSMKQKETNQRTNKSLQDVRMLIGNGDQIQVG
jgi:hypothetical protein